MIQTLVELRYWKTSLQVILLLRGQIVHLMLGYLGAHLMEVGINIRMGIYQLRSLSSVLGIVIHHRWYDIAKITSLVLQMRCQDIVLSQVVLDNLLIISTSVRITCLTNTV